MKIDTFFLSLSLVGRPERTSRPSRRDDFRKREEYPAPAREREEVKRRNEDYPYSGTRPYDPPSSRDAEYSRFER